MLKVKVERNGFKGPIPFGNEGSGRNLPFGVIVDNLGLNGLLILDNQDEREFFITADAGTREQTRQFPPDDSRRRRPVEPPGDPARAQAAIARRRCARAECALNTGPKVPSSATSNRL